MESGAFREAYKLQQVGRRKLLVRGVIADAYQLVSSKLSYEPWATPRRWWFCVCRDLTKISEMGRQPDRQRPSNYS